MWKSTLPTEPGVYQWRSIEWPAWEGTVALRPATPGPKLWYHDRYRGRVLFKNEPRWHDLIWRRLEPQP